MKVPCCHFYAPIHSFAVAKLVKIITFLFFFSLSSHQARVALYTGGQLVKELNFNAQRTNNLNWFSASKLIDSSWRDVKSESKNVFSISGLSRDNRNFFINKNYGGCSKDAGWMGITSNYCKWETRFLPRKNVILYSKLSGYTNWNQYSKSTIYHGGVGVDYNQ